MKGCTDLTSSVEAAEDLVNRAWLRALLILWLHVAVAAAINVHYVDNLLRINRGGPPLNLGQHCVPSPSLAFDFCLIAGGGLFTL